MHTRIVFLFSFCAAILLAESKNVGIISGIVHDAETGKPASGVTVSLIGLERGCPSEKLITNRDGDFQFSELPSGNYRISVFKPGYQTVIYGQSKNKIGEAIVLVPSNMRASISVSLPLGAGVSGHVYDSTRKPVAGCDIRFDPVGETGSAYFAMTDSLGFYGVTNLPAGGYLVSVSRRPESGKVISAHWYYPGTFRKEEAKELELKAGKIAAIDLSIGDEEKIIWTGRVLGPKGEPVTRAEIYRVRFRERVTEKEPMCWTGQNGECSVLNLEEGEHWFYVQSVPAINGSNFGTSGKITIGTQTCATQTYSDAKIECSIPAGQGKDLPVAVDRNGIKSNFRWFQVECSSCSSITDSRSIFERTFGE